MKTLSHVLTRRDRCYLFARRAQRLDTFQSATAWHALSEKLLALGDKDVPKFNDLLIAFRVATLRGVRSKHNETAHENPFCNLHFPLSISLRASSPPAFLPFMTPSQTKLYWRLWQAACRAQRWNQHTAAGRDQLRKHAHRAAGVPDSSKHINTTDHFDKIKAHFQMLAGNLTAAIETDHPETGQARRLRDHIRNTQIPLLCSFLCPSAPQRLCGETCRALAYVHAIAEARFKTTNLDLISDQPRGTPDKPKPSHLHTLVYTIAARLQTLRKQYNANLTHLTHSTHLTPLTVHHMHTRAGLPCPITNCKHCLLAQLNHAPLAHQPVPAPDNADDNNVPF